VVQAGATLKEADLSRNGVNSPEELFNLIYSGKGKMPGYGEGCTPRGKCTFATRMTEEEVKEMVDYVLDQASKGWQ